MADLLFNMALALLIAHELDAVHWREWRLLPILRGLPDPAARVWFTLLHVPLLAAFFWLMTSAPADARAAFQIVLAVFTLIHAGMHVMLRHHPAYAFRGALSWLYILGAAIVGGAYLLAITTG
jgi:hypothetical protein